MSKLAAQPDAPSDAELISRVRAADQAAYGVLFERHSEAARRMARQLVRGPDVDDLVSEAFTKVLVQLQRGGGPDVAFRAYLLTAIRRLHVDRARVNQRLQVTDDLEALDQDIEFDDPATASFERGAASRAFSSLPERWQLVLWHLEVEGQKPADIAPMLGMSPNSVAALAYRAREGLRQAYLQSHLADTADATCRWTTEHLGAYVRKGLAKRDAGKVEAHLNGCHRCTAVYLELTEVNSNLSGLLAPALLGLAAPGYLAAGGAKVGLLLLTPWTKLKEAGAAAQAGTAAAAVAAVVAVAAVAGGLGGDDKPDTTAEPAADRPTTQTDDSPSESPSKDNSSDEDQPTESEPEQTSNEPTQPPDDETEQPPDDEPETVPDTPTNISTDVTGSNVMLSWSPVPDAHGYRVYRRTASTGSARTGQSFSATVNATYASYVPSAPAETSAPAEPSAPAETVAAAGTGSLISGTIAQTTYHDRTLVDGNHYTYTVTSVGDNGEESPVSRPIRVTYDPVPSTPNQLRGRAHDTAVVLRWRPNPEPDIGGYQILRDGEPLATSTGPGYRDTSAPDGSTHEYSVIAVDKADQESAESSDVAVTYDPAPSAPTGLSATLQDGKVVLGWIPGAEPDLKTYEVYRNGTSLGRTTTPSFSDADIADGQTYSYTVVAIDKADQASDRSIAATATYDPAPSAPTGVEASVSGQMIEVHWNRGAEPDLKTYEVYRNGTSLGRTTTPSFSDANVADGQRYSYTVVAIDKADQASPKSSAASATYDPAPAAPTGLSAETDGHTVKLSWKANTETDLGAYRIYRNGAALTTVDSPQYVDTNPPDGALTYSVAAIDKSGQESKRSEPKPADVRPDAPTGLDAEPAKHGIDVGWDQVNSDIAEYIVLRNGAEIARTGETSYVDRTAEENTRYTYRVQAVDGSGKVSEASSQDAASWDGVPPAPTGFRCELRGETLHLAWDAPATDILYYKVRLDYKVFRTSDTQVSDDGHTGEATHVVKIRAIDKGRKWSPYAEFTCHHDEPSPLGSLRTDNDKESSGGNGSSHGPANKPSRKRGQLGGFGVG